MLYWTVLFAMFITYYGLFNVISCYVISEWRSHSWHYFLVQNNSKYKPTKMKCMVWNKSNNKFVFNPSVENTFIGFGRDIWWATGSSDIPLTFDLGIVTLTLEILSMSILSLCKCNPFDSGHSNSLPHKVGQHGMFKHTCLLEYLHLRWRISEYITPIQTMIPRLRPAAYSHHHFRGTHSYENDVDH